MKLRGLVLSIIATTALTMASTGDSISMKTTAFEEVIQTKAGKEVKVLKVLKKAIPGDVVTYINKITNPTDKEAKDLSVINEVPEHTNFVANSVSCNGCTVFYSIDGKEYKKASELFIKDDGVRRLAKAEEYSHLKFILSSLGAKSEVDVKFKTKIQ
jgi:uncharacterized repeat protein (TIGR01451 family)